MKFYEINSEIQATLDAYLEIDGNLVDSETGEVLEEAAAVAVAQRLEELQVAKEEKLESIACWIKGLDAEEAAIKAEEKNLAARRKALENKRDRIFQFLQRMLDGEKISSPRVKVSYRKTTSVNILNLSEIPTSYKRVKTIEEPDKNAIKEAIKAGETVPGAELVDGVSMSIK